MSFLPARPPKLLINRFCILPRVIPRFNTTIADEYGFYAWVLPTSTMHRDTNRKFLTGGVKGVKFHQGIWPLNTLLPSLSTRHDNLDNDEESEPPHPMDFSDKITKEYESIFVVFSTLRIATLCDFLEWSHTANSGLRTVPKRQSHELIRFVFQRATKWNVKFAYQRELEDLLCVRSYLSPTFFEISKILK